MRLSSVILVALLLTGCTTTTYYDLPSGKTGREFFSEHSQSVVHKVR